MTLLWFWNQQIPFVNVSEVCEDGVILMIIPFTGNLQRILSVFEIIVFLLPRCICWCHLFSTARTDTTLVFHILPTFLNALDGSVVLKAQVELGIHQCWDTLQLDSRVFEKQVFEGWVLLARWPKEVEGAACAHTKSFLYWGKIICKWLYQSSWKAGESKQSQRTEAGILGEGKDSLTIPELLRGSSRCHQPCYHLEPQQHEQEPWPSDRLCSCPQADGCHPDTEAHTHPSHLGHFLEEERNCELYHHENRKASPGSFVMLPGCFR